MAKLMTAKEYAKHVQADVRTVRRWMRNGKLKFTHPGGHHARLIDSSQPRPKKKETKSNNTAEQNIKPAANVTRQDDKRPPNAKPAANVTGQADKRPPNAKPAANVTRQADKRPPKITSQSREEIIHPRNPAFEKQLQSLNVKPAASVTRQADKRPPNIASQSRENVADQDDGQSVVLILAIFALAKPAIDLVQWLYKKMQQQHESFLPTQTTYRQNTWQNQFLPKYRQVNELFERQGEE